MKVTFITALQNIAITEDLGNGDKIGDHMRISNNVEIKSRFLTDKFKKIVGSLEFNQLKNCNAYLYSKSETTDEVDFVEYLTGQMYCAQDFLMATWMEKDNCINFELCFLIKESAKGYGVTSNFLNHRYWAAESSSAVTTFSRNELRTIRKIHVERLGVKMEQIPIPDSQFKEDNCRIGRALKWINSARGSLDYSIRVANFCTAFETLFSTTHNEIAHQLSERIAVFLHSDADQRLTTYQSIKRAYELRSRIVHGSTTTQAASKNPAVIALDCDNIARQVVKKIIENDTIFEIFNRSNDQLNSAMLAMVLSNKPMAL